jgi:CubicO group peptidase (beta-lactamase class C family)
MKPILFALLILPSLVKSQTIAQKADELMTAYTDQKKFSGNVLIAQKGKVLFEKAYGYQDLAANKPGSLKTEFRIGSLTKMFTSTLILQLVQDGKISLSDPVSKFLPSFENGDQVQIRHLLSHTSGIKGHTESPAPTTLEESVIRFRNKELAFQPGSRFEYNNFNFILLSYIAQKVTGTSYPELLKTRVFNKAGMKNSGLDTKDRKSDAKALGYVTNPATVKWEIAEEGDVALASGAGAMYSTVEDLYQWSKAIHNSGVIPDALFAKALQPVQGNYGLGWIVNRDNGRLQIGHTGSIPGYIANFMHFPNEDITIIMLTNYQEVDGRKLSKDLTSVVFGEPYKIPVQKKEIVLSGEVLNRYAGEYQLANGFGIEVSVEGNKLFALAKGDAHKMELTAESERKFYLKGPETEIEFIEEDSKVKYMYVDMQGGQKFTKVK